MQKTFLTGFVVLLFPLWAWAWGALGHRTIGVLADRNLTPAGHAWVADILPGRSLAEVASWADDLRSGGSYKQTVWYHFEKIEDGVAFLDHLQSLPDWQKKKGGVITAILVSLETLRDPARPLNERAEALKFLVHFVGDLHQPLHSGRPADNGGVKIDVNWQGQKTSLHHVWDALMIQTGHADFLPAKQSLAKSSEVYADWLSAHQSGADVDPNLEQWLNESLSLRAPAYDPIYNTDQAAYQSRHLPEVDRRIYEAGLRLARLVNDLAVQTPASSIETDFRTNIEKILGPLDQLISLRP